MNNLAYATFIASLLLDGYFYSGRNATVILALIAVVYAVNGTVLKKD